MTKVWAYLRRPRFSWLMLALIAAVVAAVDVVQTATGWPWWVMDVIVLGGVFVAVCVVAFAHGVWSAVRG